MNTLGNTVYLGSMQVNEPWLVTAEWHKAKFNVIKVNEDGVR